METWSFDALDHSAWSPWLLLAVGAVLLLAGKRLFWLLVAAAGALAALWVADRWLGLESGMAALLVGLVAAILGAFLAVLVKRMAIALVGFLVGAGAFLWLGEMLAGGETTTLVVLAVVVGVIAAFAASLLFDLALVVLSSVTGAFLLVEGFGLEGSGYAVPALVGLTLVGLLVQSGAGRGRRRARTRAA